MLLNNNRLINPLFPAVPEETESESEEDFVSSPIDSLADFEQPVLLRQTALWSRGILWAIIGVTTILTIWACFAKIEEAIPVQGQLKPQGDVKEVQAPVGGVVKTVHVEEGQKVKQGTLLVSMVPTATKAELTSLEDIRSSLSQENQFYQQQISTSNPVEINPEAIPAINVKPELISLTKSRSSLVAENQLYRAELNGNVASSNLSREQQQRLQSSRAELDSRAATVELEVAQLEKQARQNRAQRAGAQSQLASNQDMLRTIGSSTALKIAQVEKQVRQNRAQRAGAQSQLAANQDMLRTIGSGSTLKVGQLEQQARQNRVRRASAQELLTVNQGILQDIEPVAQVGAISRVQLLRQQQEVTVRGSEVDQLDQELTTLQLQKAEASENAKTEFSRQQKEINARQTDIRQLDEEYARLQLEKAETSSNAQTELSRQQKEIDARQTDMRQLDEEYARLQLAMSQAREKLKNSVDNSGKDLLDKIAINEQRIADIDSQLTKAIVENKKRIAEIDSELSKAKLTLEYQELRAPVDGTVFDVKAKGAGFVANSSEPVLKIVPDDTLFAEVYITNKDIGFVKNGLLADVRVDSFPFSEFGDVKGSLVSIGSDALPPDQIHPYYRFPAKIRLDKQHIVAQGKQLPLQSGMSLSANLKVRSRTVMSIFTDNFTKGVESLKFIR